MSNQLTCVGQSNVQDSNLVHLRSKQSPVNTVTVAQSSTAQGGLSWQLFKGTPGDNLAAGSM